LHNRADRVGALMRKEISDIIFNEIKDPRVDKLCTTVTHVEVSKDLRHSTVKISVRGGEEKSIEVMEGLENAKGFIRQEISKRIRLRYTPEIRLVLDHSIDYIMEIDELLREVSDDIKEPE